MGSSRGNNGGEPNGANPERERAAPAAPLRSSTPLVEMAVTIQLETWLLLLDTDPYTAGMVPQIAVRIVSEWWSATDQDSEELASDVNLRLLDNDCALPRKWPGDVKLIDLIRGVLRRVLMERRRAGRAKLVDPMSPEVTGIVDRNGLARSQRREIFEDLWILSEKLPPPYCYIAFLRLDHDASREEIHRYLSAFRPIGLAEARRLMKLMGAMMRAAAEGTDLRQAFPEAFDPKKNRWATIPPPGQKS